MAKSLKEVLTSIANKIREATTADPNATPITGKMTLEYIDDYALDFSYQVVETAGYWDGFDGGLIEGEDNGIRIGYEMGYKEGEQSGVTANENIVVAALESPVQKVESYSGFHCDFVDSMGQIQYLDENIPNVYDKGVTDGKQAEYDRFWNAYQLNGTRREYTYSFSGNAWDDEAYNPKYDIIVEYNQGINMFRGNMSITNTKVPIRFRYISSGGSTYVFNGCNNLATIPLLEVATNQTYTGWFANCINLANITMSGIIGNDISFQWCPLSKDSITSVIKALSGTTSGKTVTFKKTAVNTAFGINVDDTTTYPEGSEFYTLRHSKDNWSFNYV